MKYRKKPVVIEAFQWDGKSPTLDRIHGWPAWAWECREISYYQEGDEPCVLLIQTLEGEMTAQAGDFIIKGIKGEIYPCKPDIFDATYEAVA